MNRDIFGKNNQIHHIVSFFIILGLTLGMFGDVLFTSKDTILSKEGTDLSSQFVYWREFGFNQLRNGNLALWNPHVFSGMPFFGGFQSALLYPPNFVYLIMPLSKAINSGIALHILLAGVFMYMWTSYRGLHPLASLLSSVLFMFCGAHFMHIYAGHLPNLCTMIWAPLLFLSIDGFLNRPSLGWCLLGIFAVTMQILAGHPQYFFYTAIAAVIYFGLYVIRIKWWKLSILGFLGMYAGAVCLGAIQLLSGLEAGGESIRSNGLSYEFASMFSFPPENFITLILPGFFGDMVSLQYWGRCYLWEMSLFIGVTGFVLAIYGVISGTRNIRRFSVTMVIILTVLALGAHTPLFKVLYNYVPGFDKFRGNSKFMFQASIFIIMLVGIGLNHLIRNVSFSLKTVFSILGFAALLGIASIYIHHFTVSNAGGLWQETMNTVYATHESYLPEKAYMDSNFIKESGFFASRDLMFSAGKCLLLSLFFFLIKFSRRLVYVIVLLAIVEVFAFARTSRPTFDHASTSAPVLETFLSERTGDYRILKTWQPNTAMSMNVQDLWGYDPGVLQRYAQFMAFTQGYQPGNASQYLDFSHVHKLYSMLRCRYVFVPEKEELRIIEINDVMPRLQLIQDCNIISDRDQIFASMSEDAFDPRQMVVLETPPDPMPVKSETRGSVTILDSSTDHLDIEANIPDPAILLITDAYSKGWRARPLSGSVQKQYDVMPANYILQAIPLSKGHHHLIVEYSPLSFRIGKWISIISGIIYAGLIGLFCIRRFFAKKPVIS